MFSEVVGIDLNPEMKHSYAFDFICGNALTLDYDFLSGFDLIHASPPCQPYSKITPKNARENHMRLIAATHLMLYASGKPYVIENVEGSGKELRPNIIMDGSYFGLPSARKRYFHVSVLHGMKRLVGSGGTISIHGEKYTSRNELILALGLDCINTNRLRSITMVGMEQGYPPVMSKTIAEMIFTDKVMIW